MSISGVSSSIYTTASPPAQGAQPQGAVNNGDPDGDGGVRKSHGHGHGRMHDALAQALQSLGLSAPSATGSTAATTGTSTGSQNGGTDGDGDSDGSTSAAGGVKKDMRQFMHALFQAVKSEGAGGPSSSAATGSNGAADPKPDFASGLSTLITQVSSGQAPADLQSAFTQVVSDMQSSASASGTSTSSGSGSDASPQATLQALLTQLQQNLGYGSSSSAAAIGNFLNQQA